MVRRTYADFGYQTHRLRLILKPEDWAALEWLTAKRATSLAHVVETCLMAEVFRIGELPEYQRDLAQQARVAKLKERAS